MDILLHSDSGSTAFSGSISTYLAIEISTVNWISHPGLVQKMLSIIIVREFFYLASIHVVRE